MNKSTDLVFTITDFIYAIILVLIIGWAIGSGINLYNLNQSCETTVVRVPLTETWWGYKCLEE